MPEVVMILSPFFRPVSISCTFLRCRCCGIITRKYMMPNMRARGIKKPPNPAAPPACIRIKAGKVMFVVSYRTFPQTATSNLPGRILRFRGGGWKRLHSSGNSSANPARSILVLRFDQVRDNWPYDRPDPDWAADFTLARYCTAHAAQTRIFRSEE